MRVSVYGTCRGVRGVGAGKKVRPRGFAARYLTRQQGENYRVREHDFRCPESGPVA
jgi:hypothetical protein